MANADLLALSGRVTGVVDGLIMAWLSTLHIASNLTIFLPPASCIMRLYSYTECKTNFIKSAEKMQCAFKRSPL